MSESKFLNFMGEIDPNFPKGDIFGVNVNTKKNNENTEENPYAELGELKIPSQDSYKQIVSREEAKKIVAWCKRQGYSLEKTTHMLKMRTYDLRNQARSNDIKKLQEERIAEIRKIEEQRAEELFKKQNTITGAELIRNISSGGLFDISSGVVDKDFKKLKFQPMEVDGEKTWGVVKDGKLEPFDFKKFEEIGDLSFMKIMVGGNISERMKQGLFNLAPEALNKYRDKKLKIVNGEWSVLQDDGSYKALTMEEDGKVISDLNAYYPNAMKHANEKHEGNHEKEFSYNLLDIKTRKDNIEAIEENKKRQNTTLEEYYKNHYKATTDKAKGAKAVDFAVEALTEAVTTFMPGGQAIKATGADKLIPSAEMAVVKEEYEKWKARAYNDQAFDYITDPGSFKNLDNRPPLIQDVNPYWDILYQSYKNQNQGKSREEILSIMARDGKYEYPNTLFHPGYQVKDEVVKNLAKQGIVVKNNKITLEQYNELVNKQEEERFKSDASISSITRLHGETMADMVAIARNQDLYKEKYLDPIDDEGEFKMLDPNALKPGEYTLNGETFTFDQDDIDNYKIYTRNIYKTAKDKYQKEKEKKQKLGNFENQYDKQVDLIKNAKSKEMKDMHKSELRRMQVNNNISSLFFDEADLSGLDIDIADFNNYIKEQMQSGGMLADLDVKAGTIVSAVGNTIGTFYNEDKGKWESTASNKFSKEAIEKITSQVLTTYLTQGADEINEEYQSIESQGFFELQDKLKETADYIKEVTDNQLTPSQERYDELVKGFEDGTIEKTQENVDELNGLGIRISEINKNLQGYVDYYNSEINDPINSRLMDRYSALIKQNTRIQKNFSLLNENGYGGKISKVTRDELKKAQKAKWRGQQWWGVFPSIGQGVWDSLVGGGIQATGFVVTEGTDLVSSILSPVTGTSLSSRDKAAMYNHFKMNADWFTAIPEVNMGGLMREDGSINWAAIPEQVASTVADMYLMSMGGGIAKSAGTGAFNMLARGSKALGITGATARYLPNVYRTFTGVNSFLKGSATVADLYNRASFSAGAFAVMHPRNVTEAIMQVDDDFSYQDALRSATQKTFSESLIEAINPDVNLLPGMKSVDASDFKNYKKWLDGSNFRRTIDNIYDNIRQLPSEILEENLQEFTSGQISAYYNRNFNTEFHVPTAEDYKALNILTPLSILVAGGIRTGGFQNRNVDPAILQQAAENIPEFTGALQEAVNNPDIPFTQKDMDNALVDVQAYVVAKNNIPFEEYNQMNNSQRQETLSLMVQQEKLNKQIKETKDPTQKAKLKRDLKNTQLRFKKVSNGIQSSFKSTQEQNMEHDLTVLKARWKAAPPLSEQRSKIWKQMEDKRKERDLARDESPLYEFNGKGYGNAAEFVQALQKAKDNGFFDQPGGRASIRINNKVNSEIAQYVERKANQITGAKVYNGGEVTMKTQDVEEAGEFLSKQENAGKSLDDLRGDYANELKNKKRDVSKLNDLRNAIKFMELTEQGYVNNTDAGGMVMFGSEDLDLREIADRRLDEKIQQLTELSENSGIDIVNLDRNTIASLVSKGIIADPKAVNANGFVMAQPDPVTGKLKQVLVFNRDAIFENSANSTVTHELLHSVLFSTLNGEVRTITKDGVEYQTRLTEDGAKLIEGFLELLPSNQRSALEQSMRERGYYSLDQDGNPVEPFEVYAEEYLNNFHDLVVNEQVITNRPDDRSTLRKIKDYFVNFFKSKTNEDMHPVIEKNLQTSEQLLEFLRNFNTQAISGKFSEELMQMAASSQDFYGEVVEAQEDAPTSFSLNERTVDERFDNEQRERLAQRVNEIYADTKIPLNQKAGLIAEQYRGMAEVRFEVAVATAPSQQIRDILLSNKEDIIAQMLYDPGDGTNKARNVLGLVKDFEIEKQKYRNIAAYINKYFKVRSYEAISKITKDKMFKQQFEDSQAALQETEAQETSLNEETQFINNQIVITNKLTQNDPFNENLKRQVDDYNNDINSQVLLDPSLYTGKTYKSLKDLNPRKTIERMVNDQMVDGKYGKVYVDNGSPFWKTPKGIKQLGTPIVDGILKKLTNNDNLNQQDIRALQPYISKHASTLKIGLPQGFTTDKNNNPQKATGVQKVLLEPFYNKGKRIGNIFPQKKKPNIGTTEFLNVFGITPAGELNITGKESNVSQRIKALIDQHGKLITNQQVRKTLLETGVSENIVSDIANGKSLLVFSLGSNSDFNPKTNKVEPGFSFSEAQYVNSLIRAYYNDRSTYEFLSQADPVTASIVEDVFINPNVNLGQGEKYITSLILDKNVPDSFKKDNFKGKSYIGPKLFDSKQPGKVGEYQRQYVQEAIAFAQTIHPSFDYNTLKFLLGFKAGKTINAKNHTDLLSITTEGRADVINQIKYRSFDGDLAAEEAMLRKNGINPDIFADIKGMLNDGRIKKVLEDIVSQTNKQAKQAKLEEYKEELAKINTANKNAMKYIALKMKQAYKNKLVSSHFVYFNGQIQTNIVEGTRALSTFEYMYLLEGQQVPLKPDGTIYNKPAKKKGQTNTEYYNSAAWTNYIEAAKKMEEWSEREAVNRKQLKEKGKVKVGNKSIAITENITNNTLDLETAINIATLNDLSWKNEHVGASATTHAERSSLVFSDGETIDLNNFAKDHESAWLPTYLADKYLDAKIEIAGKMVDNKVSYEGPMRMTKFAKNKYINVFHYGGDALVDHLTKVENIPAIVESIRKLSDTEFEFENDRKTAVQNALVQMPMSRGMSTFDFDETLIDKGDNFIIATKGNDVVRISSGQWPIEGPRLTELGYDFNFDDFINVRGGVEGPLMKKFRNQIAKYGVENVFILTARPQAAAPAIHAWVKSQGIDLPIENITGLGNSTGDAKAKWMLEKFAEGYNDMYFVDDALPNVEAVRHVLSQLDIKSNVQQVRTNFSLGLNNNINDILNSNVDPQLDLNRIIEQTMGDAAEKRYSDAQAKIRGSKKGKYAFFVPPSAEDFKGLLYRLVGKGRQGEQHIAFFKKALFDPFARAYTNMNRSTQQVHDSYRRLLKAFPDVKSQLKQDVPNSNFTQEQAVRVFLWNRAGYDVPGLSKTDLNKLNSFVASNDALKAFADQLTVIMNQPVGYTPPSDFWLAENIQSDIQTLNNEITRDEHLKEFKQNRAEIFGEWRGDRLVGENMNKLEAIYGSNYRDALEDILYRMEYGRKREQGKNRLVNAFNNWANQSVGAIMFFNMRSALLQTISSINFVNWSDNNPLKAAMAFANQPQFWKDFSMIFNSDMLKQRRAGNQRGINEAELAAAIAGSTNRAKAALNWLLTKGFLPTQIADSFAIASGGATFYRNRVNTYLKQGLTQQQAEFKAFSDFQEVAEESQQSSRPDLISQQQASPLGRYILAFKNTPMQYARLMKKAFLDIKNGRGDFKSNLSKIIYYGMVQNLIFNGLQAALGALVGDDDEEDQAKAQERIINGMIDSVLGGLGFGGNAVVTIKNSIREYLKQKGRGWNADHTYTMLQLVSFSPTVGSKLRKIYSGIQTEKFNEDVIKEMDLLDIDNPIWSATANVISGVTNIPLDRLVKKVDNIDAAITEDISMIERLALLLGWNTWDLGIEDQDIIAVEEEIKEKKDIERKEKSDKKKQEKKKEQEEENKVKEEENKKKDDGRCIAINRHGERCKNDAISGGYCTIHEKKEQRTDGTKVQCSQIKSDGERCKMKTSNKSGKCYYHD